MSIVKGKARNSDGSGAAFTTLDVTVDSVDPRSERFASDF